MMVGFMILCIDSAIVICDILSLCADFFAIGIALNFGCASHHVIVILFHTLWHGLVVSVLYQYSGTFCDVSLLVITILCGIFLYICIVHHFVMVVCLLS